MDNKIKTGCSKLNINNNGLSSNEEVKNIKKEIMKKFIITLIRKTGIQIAIYNFF